MTSTALYFPYIEFQNEAWLKRSLLYWERVRRIVPPSLTPSDSATVAAFQSAKVVVNTDPSLYKDDASDYLVDRWSQSLATTVLASQSRSDVDLAGAGAVDLIHIDKIGHRLQRLMEKEGWWRSGDRWARVPVEVGCAYMTALASVSATRFKSALLSDSEWTAEIGQKLFLSSDHRSKDEHDSLLLDLNIAVPTPERIGSIPPDRLLRFREDFRAERVTFREAVESIRAEIAALDDPNAIADLIADKRTEIAAARKECEKGLLDHFESAVYSIMDVSTPAAVAFAAGTLTLGPVGTALVTTAGFGIGLRRWYVEQKAQQMAIRRSTPWSYVAQMNRLGRPRKLTLA